MSIENNENSANYRRWMQSKELLTTPGNVTDYDYILSDILKLNDTNYIISVAYDAWNATQFATNATNAGLPMAPYAQSLGNFNRPTKEIERLLKSGKVIIDLSDIVRWCFSNVRIKSDHNDNCKPDKNTKAQKIDCVISMLEALGSYLAKSGGFDISALISDVI
jgi:phage terminase large subunit-like protein